MFIPLPTPQEMAAWDNYTIQEFGLRGEILMENASREALHILLNKFGNLTGKDVVLFAGSGNNGGDAFALARHLFNRGANCRILHTRVADQYKGETAYNLKLAQKLGISMDYLPEFELDALSEPDIIVDGLLGTGFHGELREDYWQWISGINSFENSFKLAIDIPSGLSGYTGRPSSDAVRAQITVTFQCRKIGLFLPEASDFVGELYTPEIGIPEQVIQERPPECLGLTSGVFSYLPEQKSTAHKSHAGHLLIIGGSPGLTGAPTLAALGALKSGAGLCTVACPKELAPEIKQGWPEIMTLPLGPDKILTKSSFSELKDNLAGFDAVVFGPGLGRQKGIGEFVQSFLQQSPKRPPAIFDADALYWLAQDIELFKYLNDQDILTPHPGEMARIVRKSVPEIQKARPQLAREFAENYPGVLVLKGAGTVISAYRESTYISPFSCNNLAIGGAGDVLGGMMGSLKARGLSAIQAACLGVYWHGASGKILEDLYPCRGNLAQDIAYNLPRAISSLH